MQRNNIKQPQTFYSQTSTVYKHTHAHTHDNSNHTTMSWQDSSLSINTTTSTTWRRSQAVFLKTRFAVTSPTCSVYIHIHSLTNTVLQYLEHASYTPVAVNCRWRHTNSNISSKYNTAKKCGIVHRLRGSASPVLTATGFVNGKGQFSTSYRINTPRPITLKFSAGDYVGQIRCTCVHGGLLDEWVKNNHFLIYTLFEELTYRSDPKVDLRKDVPFWDLYTWLPI